MKYLKYFEEASAYEAYKNGSEFVLPNVSYIEETKGVWYEPYVEPQRLSAIINITKPEQTVTVIGESDGLYDVNALYVDGVQVPISQKINFIDDVGLHTISYDLNDPTTISKNIFHVSPGILVNYIESISIPNTVTKIGNEAFKRQQGLKNITIPDSVTSIGRDAFYYCVSLSNITIPDSVTSIGNGAFYGCEQLEEFEFNNNIEIIAGTTLQHCTNLSKVFIGNNVSTVQRLAFGNCSKLNKIKSNATIAPALETSSYLGNKYTPFDNICENGILEVPQGSNYDSWLELLPTGWTVEYAA